MTNVQAAIGVAQMEMLEDFIERKNHNYDIYCENLKDYKKGRLKLFSAKTRSNKWFYALEFTDRSVDVRQLVSRLSDEGIQTRMIWGLIHQQKPYKDNVAYQIQKAEYYAGCILNLPCSTNLKEEDIVKVCAALRHI